MRSLEFPNVRKAARSRVIEDETKEKGIKHEG